MPEAAARPRSSSSFGDDATLGEGLPPSWTLDEFRRKVRGLLDSYVSSGEADEAVVCFRELLGGAASGGLDETVITCVRLSLERSSDQRGQVASLLERLHKESVLDSPSLSRGFAKLACAWEEIAVDDGPNAIADIVAMLLQLIAAGCVERKVLLRLPEGLLTATVAREEARGGATERIEELRAVVERLQEFKRGLEHAGLLAAESEARASVGNDLGADEADRVARKLQELKAPELHHEYVKRVLAASLDWPAAERERIASLIGSLRASGVLTSEDVQWGVIRLLGSLDDLILDCPETVALTTANLRSLRAAGLVNGNFLRHCRLLRNGGATGLSVLESVLQQGPNTPALSPARAPAEEPASDVAVGSSAPAPSSSAPAAAAAAAASAPAPKSGGLLSLAAAGGPSLRPGAGLLSAAPSSGLSLRPGGGGGGLTGGLTGGYPGGAAAKAPSTAGAWREAQQQEQKKKSRRDRDREMRQQGGKGGRGGGGGSTSGGGAKGDTKEAKEEKPQKVEKLEASQNSWAAQQRRHREAAGGNETSELTDEEITRRMKSILNKLTIEKFDELYKQLTQCGISNAEHVRILMIEVFEKATTQHHFIEMYTKLCVGLSAWFAEYVKVGNFKRILLDQCQASFEANLHPPENLKVKEGASEEEKAELEEKRLRHRMRMFGNIKFVGQLLVKKMVASKVLIACAEELLQADPADGTLEPLACLMTTAGGEFDKQDWNYYKPLCGIFAKMKSLTKDKNLPSRTRFLIQDVLDLREAGWVDRKQATKRLEGPKKLEEVSKGVK